MKSSAPDFQGTSAALVAHDALTLIETRLRDKGAHINRVFILGTGRRAMRNADADAEAITIFEDAFNDRLPIFKTILVEMATKSMNERIDANMSRMSGRQLTGAFIGYEGRYIAHGMKTLTESRDELFDRLRGGHPASPAPKP